MGVFSNKISRDELKSGDHIYSWRNAYLYSHHGIYAGDGKVIHFTRGPGQEVGTGTVLDRVIFSSSPSSDKSREPCLECGNQSDVSGVISSCLDCFLWDGELYRFEYDVTVAFFLAKARGGMCTLAPCDPPEDVLRRASFLLEKGFGGYNIFKNNCEDFAIYCKTGLLVVTDISVGRSGQMTSIVAAVNAIVSSPLRFLTTSFSGLATVGCGMYCISRVVSDIGVRRDVKKIPVERLTNPDDLGQPIDTPTLPLLTSNLDKPFMKPCARDKKLQEEWAVPLKSIEDINEVFKNFCLGKLKSSPWSELDGLQPETKIIDEKLANINTKGFLTINSQPAVNGEKSDSPAVGWGGSGGFVYQKAYVELFCSKEKLNSLVDKCKALPSITYMAVNKAGDWISNVGQSDVNAVTWGVFPAKEIVQPTVVDPVSFMVWKDEAFEIWSRSWASLYAEADTSKNLLQQVQGSYYLVSLVDNDYVQGDLFSVFSDL